MLPCKTVRLVLNMFAVRECWMVLCKLLSLTFKHLGCMLQACKILFLNYKHHLVLRRKILCFQTSWALQSQILSLTFHDPRCFAVRSQPDLAIIWDATVPCKILSLTCKSLLLRSKILSLTFKHVGCYALRFCLSCP